MILAILSEAFTANQGITVSLYLVTQRVLRLGIGPRISTRTQMDDKIFTNKEAKFESLGDMKARLGEGSARPVRGVDP